MGRKLRRILRQEQGFSMILVLCIGAVFVALSAALVYAASVLTANANRQLLEQEAYQLATSFSDVLEEELNDSTSDFAQFVNRTYMTSGAYGEDPFDQEAAKTDFPLASVSAENANGADAITISLARRPSSDVYLLNRNEGKDNSVTTSGSDWQTAVSGWAANGISLNDMQLDVTVTVEKNGESFSYTVTYDRTISYPVTYYSIEGKPGIKYTWKPEKPDTFETNGDTDIVIDSSSSADVYTVYPRFVTDQSIIPSIENTIHYTRGVKNKTTDTTGGTT